MPMKKDDRVPENLDHHDLVRHIMDLMHRIMMHHAMWFMEIRHQLGREKAWGILGKAYTKSLEVQMKRQAGTLGFEMVDDLPKPLLDLSRDELFALKEAIGANWLANDGIWFQSIEFSRGMMDAKRCNDSCWGQFSPFEAWSIRRLLTLPEAPGLDGLKQALRFRLYATINKQSIVDESAHNCVFQMNDCRVQAARKRKGLADYPCKSAGMVEYPTFAESIDSRIKTECIGCPPDEHPDEWYCAWRFSIE